MSRGPEHLARRRVARLGTAVTVVVAVAAAGWFAGSRVRSPADAAASRRPPTPSPITVPVERRSISDELVRRGSVRFDQVTPLSLAGPVGGESGPQVVTRVPALGDEVTEGSVILEVNGRPVFVLQGDQPVYRTLGPGATGKDVEQLEAALQRLGFDPGAIDGTYDQSTAAAVQRLYEAKGHRAQGPTAQENAALRDARRASVDAQERVRDAETALAAASRGASGSELLALQQEIRQATQALTSARAEAERLDADAAATAAARLADLETARRDHARATEVLADATASGRDPTDPTRSCDATCMNRLRADVDAKAAAVTAAGAASDSAKAMVAATAQRGRADVARAEDQLALAQARHAEGTAPRDASAAAKAATTAREVAAQAASDLAQLTARTGTVVPAGELLFVRQLPRRIDAVKAKVGDTVQPELATMSGATLAIDTSVEVADASKVKAGMRVRMRLPDIDRVLDGSVESIATKPGTNGVGNGQVHVRVKPDDAADAARLNGLGVVVTIPLRSTGGAEVLTVPVAALTTRADRTTWVRVIDGDGSGRDVQVEVGLQGQGIAEVTPVAGARLGEGDRVVVGEKSASDE